MAHTTSFIMSSGIQPADLGFFSALAGAGSLSAAARELGITTPAVSKHLAQMEARAGVSLVNRTTRRMSLTPEGELLLEHARRILGEIDDMAQLLGVSRATPQRAAARERHARLRAQPHRAADLALCAQAPAGGSAAAAVGESAAA